MSLKKWLGPWITYLDQESRCSLLVNQVIFVATWVEILSEAALLFLCIAAFSHLQFRHFWAMISAPRISRENACALVMSPTEGFLAHDLFHFSSELKIDQKRAEKFFIINLFWKWLNYVLLCYINSDKWSWNWLNSWYRSIIAT